MSDQILISICIPAYKGIEFLKRLLDSIAIQNFKNFEVVITDDSPDNSVRELSSAYHDKFSLNYYRNESPLGTPANWNKAIENASGKWIKLMHDDDWFADENSLGHFAEAITQNPSTSFIFSAYRNHYLDTGRTNDVFVDSSRLNILQKNPATLFSRNIIGPPSVVLHKKTARVQYDPAIKWVVDIDFYIRYLHDEKSPVYINKILVNVGIGEQQVTQDCFRQRPIEIPENFYLLGKVGVVQLKNIFIYDAWWRLMRNLQITREKEIVESGYSGKIPTVISSMVSWQRKIPARILQTGIFSKAFMFVHYLLNYGRISSN